MSNYQRVISALSIFNQHRPGSISSVPASFNHFAGLVWKSISKDSTNGEYPDSKGPGWEIGSWCSLGLSEYSLIMVKINKCYIILDVCMTHKKQLTRKRMPMSFAAVFLPLICEYKVMSWWLRFASLDTWITAGRPDSAPLVRLICVGLHDFESAISIVIICYNYQ